MIDNQPTASGNYGKLLLLSLLLVLISYLLFGRPGIPESFYADSNKIQMIATGKISTPDDHQYQNVGDLYKYIGLSVQPTAAALLGLCSLAMVIFLLPSYIALRLTKIELFILAFTLLLGTVFLGSYSKDFLVCFVVLPFALYARRPRFALLSFLVLATIYGLTFRTYWLLVVLLTIVFYLLLHGRRWYRKLLPVIIAILFTFSLVFRHILGIPADHFRLRVNDTRAGGYFDAETAISPLVISSNIFGDIINLCWTYITFILPVPLFFLGSIYLLCGIFLAVLWFRFYWSIFRWRGASLPSTAIPPISFIVAYTVVQTLFEPDYGSYLRHLTPILPIIVLSTALLLRRYNYSSLLTSDV